MLQKPKNWLAETLWKPKKSHSLEQLRYLHYILQRNTTVTESNKGLLVETLRSIAEILIWGDQNDSTVFDFFLEKNMLLFFLKFMTQNCGSYVTVQLLQTLNILFENIRHETSLYFLLSNNHVNSIIVHKFDFSNEEVLAYYISFVKTLSLKLNKQTINFFFNERKSDFPLYTEGIKFFHHPESMVRIAVRTLTLNVYKVGHEKMLEFICDKTATPYFSNLIWLIGKDAIELDDCVSQEADHFKYDKLTAAVANHLDHLHYLNDILLLRIDVLNMILTDHMINRLLIPLYIYSIPSKGDLGDKDPERVHISKLVSLFLLTQHLLIMTHAPLVNAIVDVIVNENEIRSSAYPTATPDLDDRKSLLSTASSSSRAFIPPPAPLESQLEAYGVTKDSYNLAMKLKMLSENKSRKKNSTFYVTGEDKKTSSAASSEQDESDAASSDHECDSISSYTDDSISESNDLIWLANQADQEALEATLSKEAGHQVSKKEIKVKENDEEGKCEAEENDSPEEIETQHTMTDRCKEQDRDNTCYEDEEVYNNHVENGINRVFIRSVLKSLDCSNGDGEAFFALCLLYAILINKGLDEELLKSVGLALPKKSNFYNEEVLENLLVFLEDGVHDGSTMRLVTFEMCIKVIRLLVIDGNTIRTNDRHFAMIQNIREASTLQLRSFYKGDDLFVDTFEGQYHHMKAKPLNVEYITMDASLLLPLTATPLTGIDFIKRLPCGNNERTQRATYIFILMRELTLDLQGEVEHFLPLSKVANPVKQSEVLDLNNSDLIACTIVQQGRQSIRRFLVIDTSQFILVEPDTSKLGWGVVKFVSHLQDVEANPDKDDSRSLNIVIQQPFSRRSKSGFNPLPIMTAKFVFDDYIRCMSARQRLQKRRDALKHKMATIASLLELPSLASPPSHFYSLTLFDNPVWSPSSRNYSSPQQTSSSPNITSPVNLNILSSSAQKSRLLSPKHEEILQKQLKQDVIDNKTTTPAKPKSTPAVFMNTPINTPTKHEAEALANLLQHRPSPSPLDVSGHDLGREQTNTVEIGEEICEDSVTLAESSSSFVLINGSTSVERHTTSETPKINKKQMPNKKDTNKQLSNNKNTISNTTQIKSLQPNKEINHQIRPRSAPISKSNLKVDSSDLKKCPSAPCSPNDRRRQQKEESSINYNRLSKSLPVMTLENPDEVKDRQKRAQRARAKAKSVKSKGGMKKLRK